MSKSATQNPYEKYRDSKVFTASKEELTLMLYDGAIKFCNQAIIAIERKEYIKANEALLRAQNIIREFQLTLNSDYEVSKYFATMYEYMYRLLIEANMEKSIEKVTEVKDLAREFRDTWAEAMKLAKSAAKTPSPPS